LLNTWKKYQEIHTHNGSSNSAYLKINDRETRMIILLPSRR